MGRIRVCFTVAVKQQKYIYFFSRAFAMYSLQFEDIQKNLTVPVINRFHWASIKGSFSHSPLHWGCVPVHTPLLSHSRVADPVRMYPMSQEKRQICPGKLLHGAKLPWEGAVNWWQLLTISWKKITQFILLKGTGNTLLMKSVKWLQSFLYYSKDSFQRPFS